MEAGSLSWQECYDKGRALHDQGHLEQALVWYDRALEIDPHHESAWNSKTNALLRLGRYTETLAFCDRALEINPRHAGMWDEKAFALCHLGRLDQALLCCDRALLEGDSGNTWYTKGIILRKLGRLEEALTCLAHPDLRRLGHPRAGDEMGFALAELGRLEEALLSFGGGRSDPEFADPDFLNDRTLVDYFKIKEIWYVKGRILQLLGRNDEALRHFEGAKRLGHPEAVKAVKECRQLLRTPIRLNRASWWTRICSLLFPSGRPF